MWRMARDEMNLRANDNTILHVYVNLPNSNAIICERSFLPLFKGPAKHNDFGLSTENSPMPSIHSCITIFMSPLAGPKVLDDRRPNKFADVRILSLFRIKDMIKHSSRLKWTILKENK